MLQLANQFSFLLVGIFLLMVAAILLKGRQRGLHAREVRILLVLAAAIGLGWLVFSPKNSTAFSAQQLHAQIGQGKPVLIEFQSPY